MHLLFMDSDGTQTGIAISGQNWLGRNENDGELNTFQIS